MKLLLAASSLTDYEYDEAVRQGLVDDRSGSASTGADANAFWVNGSNTLEPISISFRSGM
jgi:hypothetical protein